MKRRHFIMSSVGVLAATTLANRSLAQNVEVEPIDVPKFAEKLTDPQAIGIIFTDVSFVQSWRVQLAPRGYENSGDWGERARANRTAVWERLQAGAPALVAANQDAITQYDKVASAVYQDNKQKFVEFLGAIGLMADGQAAIRIILSLRDYALLNATVFGSEVEGQAKESFYFPFC